MRVFPESDKIAIYTHSTKQVQLSSVKFSPIMGTSKFLANSHWLGIGQNLYITGGIKEIDNRMLSSNIFLCYEYKSKLVKRMTDMAVPRHSHSSIYHEDYLYVIGGYMNKTCEKFDMKTFKWKHFPNLISTDRQSSTLHIYKNFLYSFFGLTANGSYLDYIERINIKSSKLWEIVPFKNPQNVNISVVLCGIIPSVQNSSEIYILGGKCLRNKVNDDESKNDMSGNNNELNKEKNNDNTNEDYISQEGFVFNFEGFQFIKSNFRLEEPTCFSHSQLVNMDNNHWAEFNIMKEDQLLMLEIN